MAIAQETFEQLRTAGLAEVDPEIAATLGQELERQRGQIELIASENFTWPSVLEAIGSTPTNKYAEGYPGKRYYGGCEVVDEIEELARERAKALFGAEHANVQPHAGAQANMAVYFAVLSPGDCVLGLSLDHGGHLTHGLKVNFSGKLYEFHHYGVSRETMMVDYDEVLAQAKEVRPKLIVCGGSAYPRTVEADRFREIADEVGAMLMTDMAHFAGLVAAGLHPSPVPHSHFVTSTTHKTLAGPRAGFVLCTRGARPGARPRALPRDAGRAADAHDRGEGGLLPDRGNRGVPRVPGPRAGERGRARERVDRRRLRRPHRRHRYPSRPARPARHRVDGPRRAGQARRVPAHREPQHGAVRRATADGRLGRPDRHSGRDDARLRRGRLRRGGVDHRRRALRRRRREALAARSTALCDRRPLYPGFRGYTTYVA